MMALSDDDILNLGGTQEDINRYAHDNGACGAIAGGTCDFCGKKDFTEGVNEALEKAAKKEYRGCEYRWVIAVYGAFSDRGKSVLAHAEIGIGYILQNKTRAKGDNVIVAFKYPAHKLLPASLVYATPEQVYKLENKYGSKG